MYAFQVFDPKQRKYKTVKEGRMQAMLLNMTLAHLHGGNKRRVKDLATGRVVVKR